MGRFAAAIGSWFFVSLARVLGAIPLGLRLRLVRMLGAFYGAVPHGQRRALTANFSFLLDLRGKALRQARHETFVNFALTLHDFIFPDGVTIEVPEREKIEKLRASGQGILFLTFHMGHWELGARTMSAWGWPVTAVYQPYRDRRFREFIESRRAPSVNFIPVGQFAAKAVAQSLRRGDCVAMLGDHPFGEAGMTVNVLGHSLRWPKGPVVLATKENAPIVISVIVRTGPRHYTAVLRDPIFPAERSRSGVEGMVEKVAEEFGSILRQYPTQWYRFRSFETESVPARAPARTVFESTAAATSDGKPLSTQRTIL